MNAALPHRLARVLALACLVGPGCDAITGKGGEPTPTAEAPADATKAPADASKAPAAPAPPPSLLVGVIPQGIEPAADGGNTWRVDAYVAALMVEQLRKSPLPFTPWRSEAAVPGRPSAGYRVGALAPDGPWAALGLREGDIVQTVNGVTTEGPEWAAEALRLAENQVTVSVFRDDVSITLAYRLVGGLAWQSLVQPTIAGIGDEGGTDVLAVADPLLPDDGDPDGLRGSGVGGGGGGASGGSGGGGGAFDGPYSPSRPSSPGASGGGGSGGGGTSSGGGTGTGARPTPPKGTAARCSSPDVCSIDKAHFDALVSSPTKLQAQADVVPAIANDVHSGYKLRTVRSGTTVHQLGFRSGDKVTHVNGFDLTNDAEALQLYMGLSGTRVFKVRYVRGGSTRTKTIKVE